MTTKRVKFKNLSGISLAGVLDFTSENPKAFVLIAHCFTCGKNLKPLANIAKRLLLHGFSVFRFDFTGIGESKGDFSETNLSTNLDDLLAAADYLTKNFKKPLILLGHSLGGAAVLGAAHRIAEAKAVAIIATASDSFGLVKILENRLDQKKGRGEPKLILAGKQYVIKKQLIDDLHSHDLEAYIADLNLPLLVFHSPLDQIIPIENAGKILEIAKDPKSFVSLDRADHLLLDQNDARMVADILAGWATRYITP